MSFNPYSWAIAFRDKLYKKKCIKSIKATIPVISIGNINTGGSGKTPFIQFLVHEIKKVKPDIKILVVSKSYRAKLTSPAEVIEKVTHQTEIYGDEACLLKSTIDADVWSGPRKFETLEKALQQKKYDLCLIDDGFSHLKIKRDLDIVLFDVSRKPCHYRLIPLGNMREDWSSLSRADLIVLTKETKENAEQALFYKNKIKKYNLNIISANYKSEYPELKKNLYLFTGIANPLSFENELRTAGFNILRHEQFKDHHQYSKAEQIKIMSDYNLIPGPKSLVTTAKDFIKITEQNLRQLIDVVQLKLSMSEEDLRKLNEKISSII